MIFYGEALRQVCELAALRGDAPEQLCPLRESLGRVVARDISCARDLPGFDNSAMDGFALAASATSGASPASPLELRMTGSLAAGDPGAARVLSPGTVMEIMTGAPVPAGADAVARLEDVERRGGPGGPTVTFRRPVRAGENVRLRGSDLRAGSRVAAVGACVGPGLLMSLAGAGIAEVPVRLRPKVAIVSTGRELVEPGQQLSHPAQVWNSSGILLESWLRSLGCEVSSLGIVPDNPEAFREKVRAKLREGVDFLITTGAVSMGRHDFVVDALEELGAELCFHKAAIRPGKPICFGRFPRERGQPLVFGLPGNPVSTAVGARFFVIPALRSRQGLPAETGLRGRLEEPVDKPRGLRCFLQARARITAEGLVVSLLPGQASYRVGTLHDATCWAVLPEEGDSLPAGATVAVFPWSPSLERSIWS